MKMDSFVSLNSGKIINLDQVAIIRLGRELGSAEKGPNERVFGVSVVFAVAFSTSKNSSAMRADLDGPETDEFLRLIKMRGIDIERLDEMTRTKPGGSISEDIPASEARVQE
jgi:hypothetical protein